MLCKINDLMDIGWDFFQNDLRVTEVVPSQKFSEKLSQLLEQTSIASLDFSGLDQLTDEVFLVLQDKFKEQKQRDFVKSVKCLGCVYITDYGVMLMADTFPSLEEVVLDGCSSLSKVAAECLIVKCPSLKHLSMVATAVCNPPAIADREIDLQFAGCPLIPQNGEPQDAYEYPLKLVICSKANNLFSLTDFLLSSPSKSTELTPESPGIMKHSTSLKLANFEKPVNIFECHCKPSMYPTFFNDGAIYIVTLKYETIPYVLYHILSRLNLIRGSVSYTPLMVVIFHDNEKLDEKEEEFSNLYKQLSEFIEMHKQLLQLHLTAEHYSAVPEGPKVFHSRDFHAQQLYMKSHMASHQEFSLRMLTVNVATSQVRDYSTSASGDEGVCNQEEMVAIMAEVEPRVSHACALLQTLSKSEISMLKSMSSPPVHILETFKAVAIVLGNKDTSWHAIKRMLNDFTLIRNLLSFDATNITDQMLEKVGEIRKNEDLNVEKLKRSSLAAVAFWAWVDAKYLEAIALKKIAAIKAKPQVSSKTTSMGPAVLLNAMKECHKKMGHHWCRTNIQLKSWSFVNQLRKMISDLQVEKIFCDTTLRGKMEKGNFPVIRRVLRLLNDWGEIIYVSDDESDHGIIITDIQWFMEILKKLQSLQNIGVDVKVNGSRFKALPPEIPLLNVDFLVGFIEGSSTEQVKLVVRVLKISGELMTVPVTSMDEERDGQMFLFTHLQDKFYLRTGLDKGHCSSLFRKKAWAESGTSRLTTDIQIDYHYRLPIGVPPSFWPRLLQECSSIGLTASIYKWGILLKSGAAEILLVHDIHGSTVSSSIDVHARLTRWNEKTDMKTFTAYLWGAVNRYLLLVEGFANKYPFLATKVRIPCKGHGCTSLGTARTLKPIHLPTEFEGEIFCAQCGDDGMTQDETLLLTGRHNPFPMHNIAPLPSNGHMNELAPYAYEMKRLVASQEIHPLEYCVVCGVLSVASEALWRLQSNMYPCQALHCINFEKSLVKNLRIQSNFVQALPRSSEEGEGHQGWYEGLMVTRMRALRQGQMIISFSVLKPGNIEIFIGDKEAIEILNCEGISSKTAFYYHLGTGIIETVDYVKSTEFEPIKLKQQDPRWVCGVGDQVLIVIHREQTKKFSNTKSLLVIDLTVYKNGEHVLDAWVPRHKHNLAFKLHPDGESCPALIYNIPKFPMIRAAHFPLGCMLLHKTGIGNQWAVMRVLARKDGLLYLGTNKDDLNTDRITIVKPSSQKLRPYGNYSESFTVIAPKDGKMESIEYKSDLIEYMHKLNSFPAPFSLFASLPPGVTFQALDSAAGGKPQFCTMGVSPEVTEQLFMKDLPSAITIASSMKQPNFIILPEKMTVEVFLNPFRQILQNWKNQNLHHICLGNMWNTCDGCTSDVHFLDVDPINVENIEDFQTLIENSGVSMALAYHFMLQQKTILPYVQKVFPLLFEEIPAGEILSNLRPILRDYLSYFLLFHRAVMIPLLKGKEERTYSEALTNQMKQMTENSLMLTPSYKCEIHDLLTQRCQLSSVLKAVSSDKKMADYSCCVGSLMTSYDDDGVTALDALFKSFPNLQYLRLTAFPKSDCPLCMPAISILDIKRAGLPEIPQPLKALNQTLTSLTLSYNPIEIIPDWFPTEFSHLRRLVLNHNLIKSLPENFGKLRKLETFSMEPCLLDSLPDSFQQLLDLEVLCLSGVPWLPPLATLNASSLSRESFHKVLSDLSQAYSQVFLKLDEIFDKFCDSKQDKVMLEKIDDLNRDLSLCFPRFRATEGDTNGGFPKQIIALKNLKRLVLQYQGLTFIPDVAQNLTLLKSLDLSFCSDLTSLGNQLGLCPLTNLLLDDCYGLKTPPKEIREQGMTSTLSYMKRLSQGSSPCYRTKLMFVGLGGVGKTNLMRALMSSDYKAPQIKGEGITDGIDISTWSVNRNAHNLVFNVWDFAGQTVYYNTHQFFLSSRAVYMLVWNTRLGFEHSGIEFWLSSVSCHCPKAPIFIIGTHADQITNPELPTASLQERYDNIKGFYTTSSITGMGIKQVLDHLLSVTLSQPYIGELIPEAWLSFEKDILTQRKDTSLLKWSMIEEKGMLVSIHGAELREAVRFLHELGTLQHFSNELLRDLVIISPQWIVDVMACVVSVHNKVVKDGRLRHEDIKVLWKDHPEELHQWMLHLTEVFDLTFPLSDEPVNLVPCLMPHTEPKISWPNINEIPGGKESKMVYQFKYLPAGFFNRAQVRLHQFSDGSAMWKNGSQLTKNGHTALVKQISATEVLVEAIGPRPENIILLVHEVFESLISESFSGVKYEYLLPCLDCLHLTPKDPAMFSSSILSRALEKKALFLQCHSNFHTLSITEIQNIMPPKSNADYDLQLNNTMRDLDQLQHQFINDVAFIYCRKDIHESDKSVVHPKRIVDDLVKKEVKCWFADDLHDLKIEDVATSITSSKVILILVSDEFVVDTHCQRMFNYIKNTLRKDFCLLMFGKTRDWLKSDIGMQLAHVVYVNFQRLPNYDEKFEELWGQIRRKLKAMPNNQSDKKDVFLSYCWMNSAQALKVGTKGREGSLGAIDPRDMKEYLEKQGISCWLDIECAGKEGLFEDIAEGMRKSKLVLACVSDEYAMSTNCRMEFRFAHVSLKKPIILAVVGTGFLWESTEVGMLSIGYPKINFQATNENAYPQLLSHIDKVLTPLKEGGKREVEENQGPSAYQELYELAQRKFLRQVSSYVDEVHDGLYPRLLVADLNYQPEEPDPDKPTFVAENLKSGQFCMKILCEYQGGWHCVDEGLPVNIGSSDLVSLWESSGSYMLRILGILKHSKVNLRILNTLDGEKMMNKLQKNTSSFASDSLKEVYNLLRQYVMAQDYESKCGNLKRCHTSSGKMLWLCPEHQSMPGVTVLWKGDLDQNKTKPKMNEPELKLLKALVAINKKADDFQKEKQMNEKDMISEAAKKIENSKSSKIEDVQLEPECKTQGPIQLQPVPQTLIRSVGSAKSEAVSRTDDQTKIARQISARVLSRNNNKGKNMKISTTSQACLIL